MVIYLSKVSIGVFFLVIKHLESYMVRMTPPPQKKNTIGVKRFKIISLYTIPGLERSSLAKPTLWIKPLKEEK